MEEKHKIQLIEESEFFDADWYEAQYPDVCQTSLSAAQHYLRYGWKMGRNPSPYFCAKSYEAENADLKQCNENPLVHYLRFGKQEGRKTCPIGESSSILHRVSIPAGISSRETNFSSEGVLQAQLSETQKLLEKYFKRCERLQFQLDDSKK